jgi:type II secretory pathway component GspD/PulD (secretin)
MKRIFLCPIMFCVAAVFIPFSSAQPKLDRTTTIDVSAVIPRDVFASVSRLLGCELDIAPEIQKPVTMHLENVTVRTALTALSENLGCQWSIVGNTLRVRPIGSGKPGQVGGMAVISPGRSASVGKADFDKMQGCITPSNFRFENASLGSVMDALGKVCNIDLQVEESEKAHKVSMDLSNQTFLSAFKIIFEQVGPRKPVTITLGGQGSNKSLMLIGVPPTKASE